MIEIGGFQKLTLIDFPGKIASAVFLQGCNLNCVYCHNRHLIPLKRGNLNVQDILEYLEGARAFLDGVVISGGEPTIQKGLLLFAQELKRIGYAVKIDTNGTNPEMLELLLSKGLVDFVAMDVKAPLTPEKYSGVCGHRVDEEFMEKIRKSVEIVTSYGVAHEFRTTVVEELLTPADIIEIARSLPPQSSYVLQQFVPPEMCAVADKLTKPADRELLIKLKEECEKILTNVRVRLYV